MTEYDGDSLRHETDRLARDITPARDLWPGIAARIERRQHARRWLPAIAAAALIAFGAIVATVTLRGRAPAPPTVAVTPAEPQPMAESAYSRARAAYAAAAVRDSTRLAPNTQAVLLRNLRIIEMSMANIHQALNKNPNDIRLHQLLYQLYQDEAALLNAAQRVQLQTTTRTML